MKSFDLTSQNGWTRLRVGEGRWLWGSRVSAPQRNALLNTFCHTDLDRRVRTAHARTLPPPSFRRLGLPRFFCRWCGAQKLQLQASDRAKEKSPCKSCLHLSPYPSLSDTVCPQPHREDSLLKKEPRGYFLRPQPHTNPRPTLNLTANGSQAFAGFQPCKVNPSWLETQEGEPSRHVPRFYPKPSPCTHKIYQRPRTPK